MKLKLTTAILLPAIYVLLVMMLKLSSHIFQNNRHHEQEIKKDNEIRFLKELHNFHNSQYEESIKEMLIECPAKSISDN